MKSSFEVFPSGGRWSLLIGKLLLKQLRAIHDYGTDTIKLPREDGTYDILANNHNKLPDDSHHFDEQSKPGTVITSIDNKVHTIGDDTRRWRRG